VSQLGYELDDPRIVVRFTTDAGDFLPKRLDCILGPPNLLIQQAKEALSTDAIQPRR